MAERLLFVCMGNICRSPAARGIMAHLVQEAGLTDEIVCDSAGTIGYHAGEPPDRRMGAVARRRGIVLAGAARRFTAADFERFDWILAMDRANYADILELAPREADRNRVKLICDYCRTHTEREVPDPYYGGEAGFEHVFDLLTDACTGLLDTIRREHVEADR